MPNEQGPWHRHGSPRPTSRLGLYLWIALVGGAVALAWGLNRYFPDTIIWSYDAPWVIYLIALLAVISSGLIYARRFHTREIVRNIALWGGVVVILALGYTYRDDIWQTTSRVQSELLPGQPVRTGAHEIILTASEGGSFYVYGEVNGVRVRFAIDTGASDIVLSPADAKRIGIKIVSLEFDRVYETANGLGRGARVTLDDLTIGPITRFNIPASVNFAPMSTSLLGMTFLKSLKSFEVSKDRLVLHW